MSDLDDLEEVWKDLREGRPKRDPDPPPPPVTTVWIGLHGPNGEIHYEGYRRQRFSGDMADQYPIQFPTVPSGSAVVNSIGFYASETGPSLLIGMPVALNTHLSAGITVQLRPDGLTFSFDGGPPIMVRDILRTTATPEEFAQAIPGFGQSS